LKPGASTGPRPDGSETLLYNLKNFVKPVIGNAVQ
jgi:hypothetical protein